MPHMEEGVRTMGRVWSGPRSESLSIWKSPETETDCYGNAKMSGELLRRANRYGMLQSCMGLESQFLHTD